MMQFLTTSHINLGVRVLDFPVHASVMLLLSDHCGHLFVVVVVVFLFSTVNYSMVDSLPNSYVLTIAH